MMISEAIKILEVIKNKHGDSPIYFDCPKCGISFCPNKIVETATHLIETPKK